MVLVYMYLPTSQLYLVEEIGNEGLLRFVTPKELEEKFIKEEISYDEFYNNSECLGRL